MGRKLTQAQRAERNAQARAKQAAGTTTREIVGHTQTRETYSREFTIAPETGGGPRRRGRSVGERVTTTVSYADKTVFNDGRTVYANHQDVVTTGDVNRMHSHEAVPDWHTPSGPRRPGDTDTATYPDETPEQVRRRLGEVR